MISQNSSISAVLSFKTDLTGEKMEDGCLNVSYPPWAQEEFERHFLFFFFLFSLRRICSPFSSTIFLVLLAQVNSAAILFVENRYT